MTAPAATVSARNVGGTFPCPAEGCGYTMPNAGSVRAHLAMAHPEVPMDAIAPKRTVCLGGHAAWQSWICTACGKDVRGPGWRGPRTKSAPTTSAAAPEPRPDGSAPRALVAVERATPGGAPAAGSLEEVPLDLVDVGDNVRVTLEEIEELTASVAELGIEVPA